MYVKNSSGICHTFMHAVQCHAVQCHAVQCHAVQCHAVQCYAVQCHAVQCHAVQCHAVQCHAVQCHAVQCYSIMLTDYSKWRITQCCAEDSDVVACDKVVTVFAALINLSTSIVGKKLS